jgi:hypothetical protein
MNKKKKKLPRAIHVPAGMSFTSLESQPLVSLCRSIVIVVVIVAVVVVHVVVECRRPSSSCHGCVLLVCDTVVSHDESEMK